MRSICQPSGAARHIFILYKLIQSTSQASLCCAKRRCLVAVQLSCRHRDCRCDHAAWQTFGLDLSKQNGCQTLQCVLRFLTELNPVTAAALTVFQASDSALAGGSNKLFLASSCQNGTTPYAPCEAMSWVIASRKGVAAKFESRASLQARMRLSFVRDALHVADQ